MPNHDANQLGRETSPYLLQHKDNPVHWRPWGQAALDEAKAANKPILLSVGYAACHWCHVMAHESFEDEATAAVMNDLFVNIKVDREERPDVDAIYMSALHQLGEQGGWPLTMFLTPDAEPYWGGTYFPPDERYGRPGFVRVLRTMAKVYHEEPDKVRTNADAITAQLAPSQTKGTGAELNNAILSDLARRFLGAVDPTNGGLRGAPKFPQTQFFDFLWRSGLRYRLPNLGEAVDITLTHICQGGIYDHVGGGFSRYSVDDKWLVPHFEKMLYDNALLLRVYAHWARRTDDPLARRITAETAAFIIGDLGDGGMFTSSLDA
ncbi:MAG: thioredoxin domain-containing protein, partial [Methyloceanibacter sp.]